MEKISETDLTDRPRTCYDTLFEYQARAAKEKCMSAELEDKIKSVVEVKDRLKIENKNLEEEIEFIKAEIKISSSNKKSYEEKTNNFLSRTAELEKDIKEATNAEAMAARRSKDLQKTNGEMIIALANAASKLYGENL